MVKKTCPQCGAVYETRRKEQKFCSIACGGKARRRPYTAIVCQWCGKTFSTRASHSPRFCGKSCSAKWRMSRPEFVATLDTKKRRELARQRMKQNWKNPEFVRKAKAYILSDRNPFRDPTRAPALRRKGMAVQAAKGWPQLYGGNGRGPTFPQQVLYKALGEGWCMEHNIGRLKWDIANPKEKIAIEVDGHSHKGTKVKAADRRKEKAAVSKGWRVFRFWNWDVLDNLQEVLNQVKQSTT